MKNKYYYLATLLFVIVSVLFPNKAACQNIALIFMDKSSSVNADQALLEKKQKTLESVFRQMIIEKGDQIILSYIFSNTASPSNVYKFPFNPPKPLDIKMTKREKEVANVEHQLQVRRHKKKLKEAFLAKALQYENSNTGTSVFGIFPLIKSVLEENPQSKVSVYVFSDLEECTDFQKLYCPGGTTFSSYVEAENLACSDLQRAKEHFLIEDNLLESIASLDVYLPSKDLDESDSFVYLPKYWQKVFEGLGLSNSQITFH